jgi:hypothetical protein
MGSNGSSLVRVEALRGQSRTPPPALPSYIWADSTAARLPAPACHRQGLRLAAVKEVVVAPSTPWRLSAAIQRCAR